MLFMYYIFWVILQWGNLSITKFKVLFQMHWAGKYADENLKKKDLPVLILVSFC